MVRVIVVLRTPKFWTPFVIRSYSRFSISAGQVQPEERGTGTRQRGKKGCLRCTGTRKKTLDLCKGGMLGKNDSLEVVLNPAHDPGADKRGLLIGPARSSPAEKTPEEPSPNPPSGISPRKALA